MAVGTSAITSGVRMSSAACCFLHLFFFGTVLQRVRFRPVFCLLFYFGLVERVVGVAGSGEVGTSKLKMGSPSSSKRLAVLISHTGYLREGFTLVAKFASVRSSAFSGVPRVR